MYGVQLLLYDSLLAYITTACMINLVMAATVVADYVKHKDEVVLYLYLPGVALDMLCMLLTLRLLRLLRSCVASPAPPPSSPLLPWKRVERRAARNGIAWESVFWPHQLLPALTRSHRC